MSSEREQARAWVEAMDAQGYTPSEIRERLKAAGWQDEDIEGLIGPVEEVVAPPPAEVTQPISPPASVPPVAPAAAPAEPAAPVTPPPVGAGAPAATRPVTPPPVEGAAPPGGLPVTAPPVVPSVPAEAPPVAPVVPSAPPVTAPPAVPSAPAPAPVPTPAYTPPAYARPAQPQGGAGLAIAALVLGLVSLIFPLGVITAPIGVILGIVALVKRRPGQGMAIAGLIISGVVLLVTLALLAIFVPAYFLAQSADTTSAGPSVTVPEGEPEEQGTEATTPGEEGGDQTAATDEEQSICLSHLQQLSVALLMYASDHEGALPDAGHWVPAVRGFVKEREIFDCPGDPRERVENGTSFTMYEPMGGTVLSSLSEPNRAYLLFDGTEIAGEEAAADFRHDGGLNLGYADGHAQWVSEEQFRHPG